jgi:hypothetical protein
MAKQAGESPCLRVRVLVGPTQKAWGPRQIIETRVLTNVRSIAFSLIKNDNISNYYHIYYISKCKLCENCMIRESSN